jgi:hypothetical protein
MMTMPYGCLSLKCCGPSVKLGGIYARNGLDQSTGWLQLHPIPFQRFSLLAQRQVSQPLNGNQTFSHSANFRSLWE